MKDLHVRNYKAINYERVELVIKDGVGVMNTTQGEIKVNPMKKVNNSVKNHNGKDRFHSPSVDLTEDKTMTGMLMGFQDGRAWWMLLVPESNSKESVILGYHYFSN